MIKDLLTKSLKNTHKKEERLIKNKSFVFIVEAIIMLINVLKKTLTLTLVHFQIQD